MEMNSLALKRRLVRFVFFIGLVFLCVSQGLGQAIASGEGGNIIRIGFVDASDLRLEPSTLKPTLDYLQEKLPQYKFELVRISAVNTLEDLKNEPINFLIAPSSYYLTLGEDVNLVHVASRVSVYAENSSESVGSVFIAKANSPINSIKEMKGKTCAASLPNSLGGWLAACGELEKRGYDSEKFFKAVDFYQFQVPDVINAVASGANDVGILTTCVYEQSIEEGIIDKKEIKILEPQNDNANLSLHCIYSTSDLYPDHEFVALPGTPETVIRQIAVALLTMPDFEDYRWSMETNRLPLRNLFKTLKFGPYEYLKDNSFLGLLKRYSIEVAIILSLLGFLLLNEVRLHRLVRKRTRQLEDVVKEKEELNQIAKVERQKLSLLERNGVISYMSSIIAHEARQPIATVLNYIEVLRMHLASKKEPDYFLNGVAQKIEGEIDRLNSLVTSVRDFAKNRKASLVKANLAQIVSKAIRSFERNEASEELKNVKTSFKPPQKDFWIHADPLSFELLLLNLIRNGAQAAVADKDPSHHPTVGVNIRQEKAGWIEVDVWNTGSVMTESQLGRLSEIGDSTKAQGLGIGLGIVREIADHHSVDLMFRRRPKGGVVAVLLIREVSDGER